MSEEELPIPKWQRALLNCAVMATIAAISTLQASPDVTLKAAAMAGLITFLVQFKGLLGAEGIPATVMAVI